WFKRAYVRSLGSQAALSLADVDKAIELDKSKPTFWSLRGYIRFQMMKQPTEALIDYRQAMQLGEDSPVAHYYMASAYEALPDCRRVAEYRQVALICASRSCRPGLQPMATAKLESPDVQQSCPGQ